MSETHTCTGKLKPIGNLGYNAEQLAKAILDEEYPDCDAEMYDDYCRALFEESNEKYIKLGDRLFVHLEKEDLDYVDCFAKIVEKGDGTIEYVSCFYDGGTCLKEMLEENFDKRVRMESELEVIERFVSEVNSRAEKNMLKTGKLEGSHYAAMRLIVDNLKAGTVTLK